MGLFKDLALTVLGHKHGLFFNRVHKC